MPIRKSREGDFEEILAIVNAAAEAYRGVIPADRWHTPYMAREALAAEIDAGVVFWVMDEGPRLLGAMGIQDRGEVALIRHAYVVPTAQRGGIGARLLAHVCGLTEKPVLIGTWAAAIWAIAFYRKHGFRLIEGPQKDALLHRYWTIPERQVETSVVLADARWSGTS